MSAPERLVTRKGTGWTLRGLTPAGEGLYAPDAASECPQQLLATAAELAEHGVRTLLGTETAAELATLRAELGQALEDLTGANLARWEEEQDNARLRLALESAKRGRRELRAILTPSDTTGAGEPR